MKIVLIVLGIIVLLGLIAWGIQRLTASKKVHRLSQEVETKAEAFEKAMKSASRPGPIRPPGK